MKHKTTYSLLVDSEEKNRSIFETAVYAIVLASISFSVFAFASQSVTIPRLAKSDGPVMAVADVRTPPAQPVAARG